MLQHLGLTVVVGLFVWDTIGLAQSDSGSAVSADNVPAVTEPALSEPSAAEPAMPATSTAPSSAAVGMINAAPSSRSWEAGAVVGTGVLQPWVVRAEFHQERNWSVGLGFGTFSYASSSGEVDDLEISLQQVEVLGSWSPWQSAFYVNGGLGQQTIGADASSKQKVQSAASGGEELTLSGSYDITSVYLYAGVGWLWRVAEGFVLGTGFGLHLPFSSSAKFDAELEDSDTLNSAVKQTKAYKDFEDATVDAGKAAGRLALPKLELLRIGYLF